MHNCSEGVFMFSVALRGPNTWAYRIVGWVCSLHALSVWVFSCNRKTHGFESLNSHLLVLMNQCLYFPEKALDLEA